MTRENKNDYSVPGYLIGGGMMIGTGLGFITGHFTGYMFIGMGAGLFAAAAVQLSQKRK